MQQIKSLGYFFILLLSLLGLTACTPTAEAPPAASSPSEAAQDEGGVFKDDFESGKTEGWSGEGDDDGEADDDEKNAKPDAH